MENHTVISKSLRLKFWIRTILANIVQKCRNKFWRLKGYDIHPSTIMERNISLDRLYPQGIHIGENCLIASGVTILSHDHCKRSGDDILSPLLLETYIGKRCFVAVNSLILPGVKIGNECIVGAGSVVTKDVKDHCIVAGNPAKVIRTGIRMSDRAELLNWNVENGWVD